MSRYDELTELAATYGRQFFDEQTQCRRLAIRLAKSYAEYLGCPVDRIKRVKLDAALKLTTETFPLGQNLPLIVDREGFGHVCYRIEFDSDGSLFGAHENLVFALRYKGGKLSIREEKEFNVDPGDPASFVPFFEHLFESSRHGFGTPYGATSKRIGFIHD